MLTALRPTSTCASIQARCGSHAEVLEAGPETDALPAGTSATSLPVLLSPKGFEPILSSNTTIGGYAERMLLSAPLLLRLPDGMDPRHAALTEPMAVGLHAVNRSGIATGDGAVVMGCGPVGLAVIAALRVRAPSLFTSRRAVNA